MGQMSTGARLVYMANQIAANFAAGGERAAAIATADHIATFWDPRMRRRVGEMLDDGAAPPEIAISPIARRALELLREQGAPMHQTMATVFGRAGDVGGSDAG